MTRFGEKMKPPPADLDTLFAFCGNKIWSRKVRHHAMGALWPWTKVSANKL